MDYLRTAVFCDNSELSGSSGAQPAGTGFIKEFGWSNTDYANITAVFQFVYAISMLFAETPD
jgi:hypothetical protein